LEGKVPKLTYLSLLKNECCPNYFIIDKDSSEFETYRYTVLAYIPTLLVLDTDPVTEGERIKSELYRNTKAEIIEEENVQNFEIQEEKKKSKK